MHKVAELGSAQAVAALLKLSTADVATPNAQRNTPIHLSSSYEVTSLLISNVDLVVYSSVLRSRNLLGHSPLALASSVAQADFIISKLKDANLVDSQLLLDAVEAQAERALQRSGKQQRSTVATLSNILKHIHILHSESIGRTSESIAAISADSAFAPVASSWWTRLESLSARRMFVKQLLAHHSFSALTLLSSLHKFEQDFCSRDKDSSLTLWSEVNDITTYNSIIISPFCMSTEDSRLLIARAAENGGRNPHAEILALLMTTQSRAITKASSRNDTTSSIAQVFDRSITIRKSIIASPLQSRNREISISLHPSESVLISASTTSESSFVHLYTRSDFANVAGYEITQNGHGFQKRQQLENNYLGWYPSWTSSAPGSDAALEVVVSCTNKYSDCHLVVGAETVQEAQIRKSEFFSNFYLGPNLFAHARLACLLWVPLGVLLPTAPSLLPITVSLAGFYAAGPAFLLYWVGYTMCSLALLFLFRIAQRRL